MDTTKLIEDDLDSLDFKNQASAVASKIKTASANTAAPTKGTFTLKFGDKKLKEYGDGLDRVKPDKDKKLRFALIPGVNMVAASTHFISTGDKKGLFICPGNCPRCKTEDARLTVAALVLVYSNADSETGKLAKDSVPSYKIGYLSLSQSVANAIGDLAQEDGTPYDFDIAMGFDGRRYSVTVIARTPRYVQLGDTDKVIALAKPFIPLLQGKVGRVASAQVLASGVGTGSLADLSDMDE
jgi:hypothetical protein